ncbi:MAG: hypothetical protein WKF91_13260 [Segetibacter sp.]
MKASLILIVLYISTSAATCFSTYTEVSFQNKSDKFIDSVVVYIQNYKFSFNNINKHAEISKKISKDSIIINKHDITVHAYLYDKGKSNFEGGFYYNDLSGSLNDKYLIILNDNLNVTIR